MTQRFAAFLILLLITVALVWTQFFWPIYGEETDYVRFALWPLPDIAWISQPFYLADGHPPLLSLLMSSLVAYVSPLSARVAALAITLGGMWFLFSWSSILRIPLWSALLLSLFILFLPVHQEILTSMYSDLPGFVFLMGWAYFRHAQRLTPAMLCLLMACLMRETHVLPALLYLALGWKGLDLKRTAWVELVSVFVLASYYTWSKLSVGFWYPFSGKVDIGYGNLLNVQWLFSTLPIMLPLAFVVCLRLFPKSGAPKPLVLELTFLAPLAATLICSLAPYLATFHKARLLTPFISFFWLALLTDLHDLKLKPAFKTSLLLAILGASYAIHHKFLPRTKRAEKIEESRQIADLALALDPPPGTIVTGDWPHALHLTFDRLGFVPAGSLPLNRNYFPVTKGRILESDPAVPHVYFATENRPERSHTLIEICELGCEEIQILSPDQKVWTLYLRNVSPQIVQDARNRLWPPPTR